LSSAEIKATAHNGVYATCSITVNGEEQELTVVTQEIVDAQY